ncbi:MAG: TolC family protein [Saprospiraceae bacterium]
MKHANFPAVLLLVLSALAASNAASAQIADFDMVVQPIDAKARDLGEYLVQLAWMNNPESAIAQTEVRKAEAESRNRRKEWMRDVQATFNLNEANLRGVDSFGNVFFPRYNFGLNLNLNRLFTQKDQTYIGKQEVLIAQHKVNLSKLELRAETLSRYARFQLAREIVKTRAIVEQEAYNNFVLIQQLYKTDEKTFEDYSTASSAYYTAQEARIRAESDLLIAKILLEELIGIRWEQVLHPAKVD